MLFLRSLADASTRLAQQERERVILPRHVDAAAQVRADPFVCSRDVCVHVPHTHRQTEGEGDNARIHAHTFPLLLWPSLCLCVDEYSTDLVCVRVTARAAAVPWIGNGRPCTDRLGGMLCSAPVASGTLDVLPRALGTRPRRGTGRYDKDKQTGTEGALYHMAWVAHARPCVPVPLCVTCGRRRCTLGKAALCPSQPGRSTVAAPVHARLLPAERARAPVCARVVNVAVQRRGADPACFTAWQGHRQPRPPCGGGGAPAGFCAPERQSAHPRKCRCCHRPPAATTTPVRGRPTEGERESVCVCVRVHVRDCVYV
jgi:hypothetical protein